MDDSRPSEVSMMHPIELPLERDVLIDLVRANLDYIQQQRVPDAESLDQRRWVKAMVQQRVDFLAWLNRRDPQEVILLAMYPAQEVHDLLADLPEDLGDDPFNDLPLPEI